MEVLKESIIDAIDYLASCRTDGRRPGDCRCYDYCSCDRECGCDSYCRCDRECSCDRND